MNDAIVNLTNAFNDIFNNVYSLFQGISLPILGVVILINCIKLVVASDSQSVNNSKKWLLIAVIAFIAIFSAPTIVETIGSIASSLKTDGLH